MRGDGREPSPRFFPLLALLKGLNIARLVRKSETVPLVVH